MQVKLTDSLPSDGTWRRPSPSRPYVVIYCSSLIGPRRREFTIAHELMEANLPHDRDGRCTIAGAADKEAWCDRGAAALLMPREAFLASGTSCGWDLSVLREWWPHCSWLALARRMTDLVPGVAASSWRAAELRFRQGELPEDAAELEALVAREAQFGTDRSEVELGGVVARAWRSGPGRAVAVVRRTA